MLFNVASLVLGIGAWILALLAIITSKAVTSHRNTVLSFSFCAFALVSQLLEINRRVSIGDYSAIEDTIEAIRRREDSASGVRYGCLDNYSYHLLLWY